jgi:predicted metal-dependent peptidase
MDTTSNLTKEELRELDRQKRLHEDAQNFDIRPFFTQLMDQDPFYASISRRIRKVRSSALPTAGVTIDKNHQIILIWNPIFFSQLEKQCVRGVLKHEYLHIILEHIVLRKKDEHMVWNYATDCAINSMIPRNQLPDCAIIPGERPELPEGMDESPIADFIESLPPGKSSDWYYEKFMSNKEVSEELAKLAQESEDSDDASNSAGQFDSHDGWSNSSGVEREIIKGKLKDIIKEAVNEADRRSRWGDVPVELKDELRKLISTQVNWRQVVRSFCGMAQSSERRNTRLRRNRKYGIIHPGKRRDRRARILVAFDQSGSVTNSDAELFFGELTSLSKHIDFTVVHFDTCVDEENMYGWRRGQIIQPSRTRWGGTDFNAPTRYANENKSNYDALLILTDGQAPKPIPCYLKRAWVICPGNTMYFDTNEMIIKLTNESN